MKYAGLALLGMMGTGAAGNAIGRRQGFDSYNEPALEARLAAELQAAQPGLTLNQAEFQAMQGLDSMLGTSRADGYMMDIGADQGDMSSRIILDPRQQHGVRFEQVDPVSPHGYLYQDGELVPGQAWANGYSRL